MNAATARETKDPELRWRREEPGGAVAAGIEPPMPTLDDRAELISVV